MRCEGCNNNGVREMKKVIFGTLAAATLVASVTTASAQTRVERNWFDVSVIQTPQGGASAGYNMNLNSRDAIK